MSADLLKSGILSLLKIGVVAYIGICVVLWLRQSRMVYFPSNTVGASPNDIKLDYEDVYFSAADGVKLNGWFLPCDKPRGSMLICHGNGGNIGDRLPQIQLFHELGFNVFIFDYRGYGRSMGKPSEQGTYQDVLAAWNYLVETRGIPENKIALHGRSLGGAIATWLASQRNPAALVIEATFTSIPDIGAKLYPYLPIRLICTYSYNTVNYIKQIKCPVLIAHSKDDEMIPFSHGQALFQAAAEPKRLVALSGSHNEGEAFFPDEYRAMLSNFLNAQLPAGD